MESKSLEVWLIGCGKMGTAMLQGWLSQNISAVNYIIDPTGAPDIAQSNERVQHFTDLDALSAKATPKPDCIVLAVKPQIMDEVCLTLKNTLERAELSNPTEASPSRPFVLSIAAGKSLSYFSERLPKDMPVIRSMPNTPAAIGKGITAAIGNSFINETHKHIATKLLSVSGLLEWVENEELFHAITALSGSGPAYVFLLIETLKKSGIACGLPEKLAEKLARQTVIGAASLAESDPGTQASVLRQNVTSPGGTTEAALNVLMDGRLDDIFAEGLKAAALRSKDL